MPREIKSLKVLPPNSLDYERFKDLFIRMDLVEAFQTEAIRRKLIFCLIFIKWRSTTCRFYDINFLIGKG